LFTLLFVEFQYLSDAFELLRLHIIAV
jgi:hypothetical protein